MSIETGTEQAGPESTGVIVTHDEPATEAAPLSVMEHAKLHGDLKDKTPAEEKTALEEKAAHHSESQKREKDTGKFTEGKARHRAKSQQASPDDVPRIRELTGRLRAAEEEVTRLKAAHASPERIATAERKVEQADTRSAAAPVEDDPEPTEDDPKYGGDYGKFLSDQARWAARDEHRKIDAKKAERTATERREAAQQETLKTFAERVTAAKDRYGDDYADTLAWDVPWLQQDGTPHRNAVAVDQFIMEHEAGPDVLHFLRTHPDEIKALSGMSPLQQIARLTLLSQRTAFSPSQPAGSTGAAAASVQVKLPHRPPTPVRTEARSVSGPPPTDGTLSVAEHAKRFARR